MNATRWRCCWWRCCFFRWHVTFVCLVQHSHHVIFLGLISAVRGVKTVVELVHFHCPHLKEIAPACLLCKHRLLAVKAFTTAGGTRDRISYLTISERFKRRHVHQADSRQVNASAFVLLLFRFLLFRFLFITVLLLAIRLLVIWLLFTFFAVLLFLIVLAFVGFLVLLLRVFFFRTPLIFLGSFGVFVIILSVAGVGLVFRLAPF
mmetsp:Transcript_12862/g.25273  ORF Transcript_12862/g.25273 Transcript_12862/m.25273 type:complete len:205 (-) Transcript_12862:1182-1796(-)